LKLPTGVRAALTMTTSSDMDISWGLRFWLGGRRIGRPVSRLILLTSLRHVNRPEAEISPRRTQNDILGVSISTVYALELTVLHKTVAEPY
jgi:hypothetical protein